MAIGRKGRAVERAVLKQRLRDLPRLQFNDLNALLAPAAEHDHRLVASGRDDEVDGQAAEFNHITHRIEPHAGG